MAAVPAIMMGAGIGMSAYGQYQGGKYAQRIANQRAAVDMANAEAVLKQSREKQWLMRERGEKLIKRQKAQFAASGVRLDVGSPLVVEAQTRADLLRDLGYVSERGKTTAERYRNQAYIERKYGKYARRQSIWSSVGTGMAGFGSLGLRVHEMGGIEALFG